MFLSGRRSRADLSSQNRVPLHEKVRLLLFYGSSFFMLFSGCWGDSVLIDLKYVSRTRTTSGIHSLRPTRDITYIYIYNHMTRSKNIADRNPLPTPYINRNMKSSPGEFLDVKWQHPASLRWRGARQHTYIGDTRTHKLR